MSLEYSNITFIFFRRALLLECSNTFIDFSSDLAAWVLEHFKQFNQTWLFEFSNIFIRLEWLIFRIFECYIELKIDWVFFVELEWRLTFRWKITKLILNWNSFANSFWNLKKLLNTKIEYLEWILWEFAGCIFESNFIKFSHTKTHYNLWLQIMWLKYKTHMGKCSMWKKNICKSF